jgi:hypothetical protein
MSVISVSLSRKSQRGAAAPPEDGGCKMMNLLNDEFVEEVV